MLNSFSPNSASESDGIPFWDQETLRLLTFEALEMSHTCCAFERVDQHDPYQMAGSTVSSAIFSCDPTIVSETRCCSQEQATASLLEELMTEFTGQLQLITPGPTALITFISTYWRRRISELYKHDYQVAEDLRQYQTFRGFQASSETSTGRLSLVQRNKKNCVDLNRRIVRKPEMYTGERFPSSGPERIFLT